VINDNEILELVQTALAEDVGTGDVTSKATMPASLHLTGKLVAKADGIIAGMRVAQIAFTNLDPEVQFDILVGDGEAVQTGDVIANVAGRGRSLLTAERVALNFLQRMSGIATMTSQFVREIAGTSAQILDTRKTVPGLRMLDKMAVKLGGGTNHRIGLYDMVLIKENHIAAAGGIRQAVERVRAYDTQSRPIEVEVTNLDELCQTLPLKVDRIMLDNMSLADMRQAVALTNGQTKLEASGNVSLQTVGDIAKTGVDFISSGALTHSVTALDISFLID
jgi:nicotinate-nucleotide pyrophosphorylase (carboxylating)